MAPVAAQDSAAAVSIVRLNKAALDAFDNLNFDQARALLEQALTQARGSGLIEDPVAARTHLNLGMLFIAGFQQRDAAVEQFKSALKIQPDIAPPPGLFNPDVQSVFDEVKAAAQAERASARVTPPPPSRAAAPPAASAGGNGGRSAAKQGEAEDADGDADGAEADDGEAAEDEEGDEGQSTSPQPKYFLAVAVGSGLGVARGELDANKDLDSNGDGLPDNKWTGGLAPSRLGHLTLGAGYFLSRDLLVSLQGRLQVISGTTTVNREPPSAVCVPSCTAPSTAIAVFAKAEWFLSPGPLRPFLSGGIGGGSIRQVVQLNVAPSTGAPAAPTGCGTGGNQACVDTVTGGPFWMAVGGGLAYEIGSYTLLGSLTANVGVPNIMLNVDALFGLGLRL